MASPTPPTSVIAAVAALAGFVLYRMIKSVGGPTHTVSGVRFWNESEANALRAALEQSHVAPTIDAAAGQPIERVMTVLPGAGTPADNALAWVRKVQATKHLVTSSENLLDKSAAKRLVADILPAEEASLASAAGVAVLPPL